MTKTFSHFMPNRFARFMPDWLLMIVVGKLIGTLLILG